MPKMPDITSKLPGTYFQPKGGPLGVGIPGAIGAKFVICNNHRYKLLQLSINQYWKERNISVHQFPDPFSLTGPDLDFVNIAKGMSVSAIKVEKPEEVIPAIKKMLETKGPFLIDLVIEPA
jgi:benzoylformate decarboxylase